MVTAAIPEEVSVTGSVDDVFTVTSPNARLAGLMVNCEPAAAAFSCKAKVLETLPALAVRVTACAVVTEDTVAVNPALVALAGTTTVAGTATAALLLARLTLKPALPAATARVTVQLSLPDPVIDALVHESAPNVAGTAVPVAAGVFTTIPQPNGRRATRKHANRPDNFVHRPSSLEIEPRSRAQYELSTRVTCVSVRAFQKDTKMWRVLRVKLRKNSILNSKISGCNDVTALRRKKTGASQVLGELIPRIVTP
jgi:hypothetical protein